MNNKTASKKFRVGILAGLLSVSLAGVGVQSAHAVTELRFAALAGIDGNFKPVIEQWNKENPDIQIKIETLPATIPDIVKSLAASALSGSAPDLINNLDTYADQLADVGFTEDLVKWFGTNGTIKRSNFNQAFLSSYVPINFPKQVTGLPIAADAIVVFYNKTLFKKAGVAFPKAGWTYDEYLSTCDKLSKWGAKQKPQVWGNSGGPGGGSKSIWQAQYNPFLHSVGTTPMTATPTPQLLVHEKLLVHGSNLLSHGKTVVSLSTASFPVRPIQPSKVDRLQWKFLYAHFFQHTSPD